MDRADIAIVGAGHGGAQAASLLRQRGFAGSVALIGDEPELPYERPPLSKEYLSGDKSFERILIRPAAFWADRDIITLPGRRVTAVEPDTRTLRFADGGQFGYGELIWATGGSPRRLSCEGWNLRGVHGIRTRSDVDAMISELERTDHVVVIGGGYIGLEAAAVLTKLGKRVTLIEALDRVLSRVAGEPLSRFYEAEHRSHGVDLRTGVGVTSLEGKDGHVAAVHTGDGDRITCDMAIVGIGIVPAVEPLLAAGAKGSNGVNVDSTCRTTLPHIFAIGDCAAHENDFAGGARIRLESVQNANDQAATAVDAIMGKGQPYGATPWFWSNQYDLRLQTVGLSTGHDNVVVRGDPESRCFSLIYLRDNQIIALDSVNCTKDFVQGRKLVEARGTIDARTLADTTIALKSLVT